jgi:cytochrome c oxidase cbb3-type subunit III
MRLFSRSLYRLATGLLVVAATSAISQAPPQKVPQRKNRAESGLGKRTFGSTCAGCHGLDGKGGDRAPNIADRPSVQRLSDVQIFGIIQDGVPGTGMPAFHSLESSQITAVVGYLRSLQGTKKVVSLPGDPERGRDDFFNKGKCSSCHIVGGQGGFIASDLSEYANTHTVEQIRSAIIQPLSNSDAQAHVATAILRGGEKYVGRVRNEDNFSLQLQTLDGVFHFLSKSDLESIEYDSQTLMPSDYGSTLSPGELKDLISFLMSVSNPGKPATKEDE